MKPLFVIVLLSCLFVALPAAAQYGPPPQFDVGFGVGTVFALIFRYVPAVKVPWRNAWKGGMITSVLFTLGKYLIGFYLAKAAPGSAYGTAGSVIVVIVWVYYTAQIVFMGAEFTHLDYTRETNPPRPA